MTTDTTAWPDTVIARYLTVVGAVVDVTRDGPKLRARCSGRCGFDVSEYASHAHESAQRHAERCRALPRPEAAP